MKAVVKFTIPTKIDHSVNKVVNYHFTGNHFLSKTRERALLLRIKYSKIAGLFGLFSNRFHLFRKIDHQCWHNHIEILHMNVFRFVKLSGEHIYE